MEKSSRSLKSTSSHNKRELSSKEKLQSRVETTNKMRKRDEKINNEFLEKSTAHRTTKKRCREKKNEMDLDTKVLICNEQFDSANIEIGYDENNNLQQSNIATSSYNSRQNFYKSSNLASNRTNQEENYMLSIDKEYNENNVVFSIDENKDIVLKLDFQDIEVNDNKKQSQPENTDIDDKLQLDLCSIIDNKYDFFNSIINEGKKEHSQIIPNYFEIMQIYISPKMRFILLNWIMQVSAQFNFKRETYHLSVKLIDLFLQKNENVKSSQLQLIGVSCFFIASKMEEIYIPRAEMYSSITENTYPIEEILNFEIKILECLDWKSNYCTLATWSNIYLLKWDEFASQYYDELPLFRVQNNSSYNLFKTFFQLIDFISLDCEYRYLKESTIVFSLIYIVIGLQMNVFDRNSVIKIFPIFTSSLNNYSEYNNLFQNFLSTLNETHHHQLYEGVQFCSKYLVLNVDNIDPNVNEDDLKSYEDFLQVQTFNHHFAEGFDVMKKFVL